jgi:hypothetical protein
MKEPHSKQGLKDAALPHLAPEQRKGSGEGEGGQFHPFLAGLSEHAAGREDKAGEQELYLLHSAWNTR